MATEAELKKVGIKAIEDDAFRGDFHADPAKAAATLGITFTPEQLGKIKKRREVLDKAGLRESKMMIIL
jgi:regulator of PEP synthase PpsR (kinase-PPPase family)